MSKLRQPLNVTQTNKHGYVAVKCNAVVRQPVFVQRTAQNMPHKLKPRSATDAIKHNFAQILDTWLAGPPLVSYEYKPCGNECAVIPGIKSHCTKCKSPLFVQRVEPKPFKLDWRDSTSAKVAETTQDKELCRLAKSVSRRVKSARLKARKLRAIERAKAAQEKARLLAEVATQ